MEEEKTMTAERSLEIIRARMEQSQRDIVRNAGKPMVVWGIAVVVFGLLIGWLWHHTGSPRWNLLWFVMVPIGFGISHVAGKSDVKVRGYVGQVLGIVWLSFAFFATVFPFVGGLFAGICADVLPMGVQRGVFTVNVTATIIILLALCITITGGILKNGWITGSGILTGVVGTALALVITGPWQSVLMAAVGVVLLIVPGVLINLQTRN